MTTMSLESKQLNLSLDEAYALLGLCMTSPDKLDETAETAMHKLAEYCKHRTMPSEHSTTNGRKDRSI